MNYVTLYDKEEFADVIKLMIWRLGDYPRLSMWFNLITQILKSKNFP